MQIFQYYTERTPGAYVESKDTSIVWVNKKYAIMIVSLYYTKHIIQQFI